MTLPRGIVDYAYDAASQEKGSVPFITHPLYYMKENFIFIKLFLIFFITTTAFTTQAAEVGLNLKLRNILFNNDFMYETAIDTVESEIKDNPNSYKLHYVLAILYFQIDDEKVESELKTVIKLKKDHAKSYYLLGSLRLINQNFMAASQYYEKAISIDSKVPAFYNSLAQSYLLQNKKDEAYKVLTDGIRNIKNDDSLLWNMSLLLSRYFQNKEEEIIEYLHKAIEVSPDDEEYHFVLSVTYLKSKNYKDARIGFEKTVGLNPKNIYAILGLATTYKETKQFKRAIELVEQALVIEPNNKVAQKELREYEEEYKKWKKRKGNK